MPYNATLDLHLRAELSNLLGWITVKHQYGIQTLVFITEKLLKLHLSF